MTDHPSSDKLRMSLCKYSKLFSHSHAFYLHLTLSWRRPLSYRNQSTDLQSKSMDWFLYDNDLRHERVNKSDKNYVVIEFVLFTVILFTATSCEKMNVECMHSSVHLFIHA